MVILIKLIKFTFNSTYYSNNWIDWKTFNSLIRPIRSFSTNYNFDSSHFVIRISSDLNDNSGLNNNQFYLPADGNYDVKAENISTGAIENFTNLNGSQTLTFSNGPGVLFIIIIS